MKPLCIYHGNCADGFGAAWVVRQHCLEEGKEVPDFHAGVYQNPPPVSLTHLPEIIRLREAN